MHPSEPLRSMSAVMTPFPKLSALKTYRLTSLQKGIEKGLAGERKE